MKSQRRNRCAALALSAAMVLCAAERARCEAIESSLASPGLGVRTIAEVESRPRGADQSRRRLTPADRVVPGDRLIYTLEVRNFGALPAKSPVIIEPVPQHTRYIRDSAVGPGAEITYSVDGGHHFASAAQLRVPLPGGSWRGALEADITHIRWILKNPLDANSTAFLRFRAVVK